MVADFRKAHGRAPTFYGAQSYDAINLIASAVAATKGDLKNKPAVRKAMEAAKFDSVRGAFKFGPNHFPIHNVYQQEARSEEHTSELQSLMRISYAVFCLKKKKNTHLSRTQIKNKCDSKSNKI